MDQKRRLTSKLDFNSNATQASEDKYSDDELIIVELDSTSSKLSTTNSFEKDFEISESSEDDEEKSSVKPRSISRLSLNFTEEKMKAAEAARLELYQQKYRDFLQKREATEMTENLSDSAFIDLTEDSPQHPPLSSIYISDSSGSESLVKSAICDESDDEPHGDIDAWSDEEPISHNEINTKDKAIESVSYQEDKSDDNSTTDSSSDEDSSSEDDSSSDSKTE